VSLHEPGGVTIFVAANSAGSCDPTRLRMQALCRTVSVVLTISVAQGASPSGHSLVRRISKVQNPYRTGRILRARLSA
jgi:hypothetical protein